MQARTAGPKSVKLHGGKRDGISGAPGDISLASSPDQACRASSVLASSLPERDAEGTRSWALLGRPARGDEGGRWRQRRILHLVLRKEKAVVGSVGRFANGVACAADSRGTAPGLGQSCVRATRRCCRSTAHGAHDGRPRTAALQVEEPTPSGAPAMPAPNDVAPRRARAMRLAEGGRSTRREWPIDTLVTFPRSCRWYAGGARLRGRSCPRLLTRGIYICPFHLRRPDNHLPPLGVRLLGQPPHPHQSRPLPRHLVTTPPPTPTRAPRPRRRHVPGRQHLCHRRDGGHRRWPVR